MESRFDFKNNEKKIYNNWEENGYFKCDIVKDKKPFVIAMPPPNVTAKLHIGHALDNTVQDVFVRYNRMKGTPTLWVPGTDHASIATEVKVIAKLKEEGKTKDMLGREGFLKEAWNWKEKYGGEITNQLRKLGCSCDWSREQFTMSDNCSNAVLEVFERLYKKGLIYKGERIVNWCPSCKTPISETEVDYEEQSSYLWHIKYPIENTDEYLIIATTRPETMLGDTAVAVNPDDKRYKHLIGKRVLLPIVNKYIPIISDYYVDIEFGTGVVKMTPAHDPNDFQVGQRHNLEIINILNEDATLNENAGEYVGLDRDEARRLIVERLKKEGYLLKEEPYKHNVGSCYRCHTTIEPYISNQWFVKMKELVEPAIKAVRENETKFIPKRFEKTYFNWMENIEDWCISRQLWWGHRIPAYYCGKCGKIEVSKTKIDTCKCGGIMHQDEDTLDTWFSSALWPFSIFGFPNDTEDLKYFYPTTTLVTAYDIITFWVSKMIFSGIAYMGEVPFENVYIHGLVRDAQGRKMSKSLGNGVDPLEVIENYGTDALRFSLIQNISPGNDVRYMKEKVESSRNFTNKLWNAAKFVNMYIGDLDDKDYLKYLKLEDKWILNKLSLVIDEVTNNIEKFEIGVAAQLIYDFIWSDFCDLYIEMVKPRLYAKNGDEYLSAIWTLNYTLVQSIKLLHPYMPYITEEIYQNLKHEKDSIMISNWPEIKFKFNMEQSVVDEIIESIKQIRNIRAVNNIQVSRKLNVQIFVEDNMYKNAILECSNIIKKLASVNEITYIYNIGEANKDFVAVHNGHISMYVELSSCINKEEEIAKLNKEKDIIISELQRANKMLQNESFVAKAPKQLIEKEKEKVKKYSEMLDKVEERINSFE